MKNAYFSKKKTQLKFNLKLNKDGVYNSFLLFKLINKLMKSGNKHKWEIIFYKKFSGPIFFLLNETLIFYAPIIGVFTVKFRNKLKLVPTPLRFADQYKLSLNNFIKQILLKPNNFKKSYSDHIINMLKNINFYNLDSLEKELLQSYETAVIEQSNKHFRWRY